MPIRIEHPAPHIVLVTIDNPEKRNAMSRAMMAEMAAITARLAPSSLSWNCGKIRRRPRKLCFLAMR